MYIPVNQNHYTIACTQKWAMKNMAYPTCFEFHCLIIIYVMRHYLLQLNKVHLHPNKVHTAYLWLFHAYINIRSPPLLYIPLSLCWNSGSCPSIWIIVSPGRSGCFHVEFLQFALHWGESLFLLRQLFCHVREDRKSTSHSNLRFSVAAVTTLSLTDSLSHEPYKH